MGLLFALDKQTESVVVSESVKNQNKITFKDRIFRKDNDVLYNATTTLTSLTNSTEFNAELYMSMDKICQMIYENHKKKSQL